jgi:hypothetical protein
LSASNHGKGFKDLTGMIFGKLEVMKFSTRLGKAYLWECQCECGKTKIVSGSSLKAGYTKSCGCIVSAMRRSEKTHGMTNTSLYYRWRGMLSRCEYPKQKGFKNYGGRGITVCKAWHDAETFIKWSLANGYTPELTIDRKDNEKGYSPSNCRWTTKIVQRRNQRRMMI